MSESPSPGSIETPDTPILDGIRIIDMSSGIPGPVATHLLAEAGADVIKVEPPSGDPMRTSPGFETWNRSKRGVVLDLHEPADRASPRRSVGGRRRVGARLEAERRGPLRPR